MAKTPVAHAEPASRVAVPAGKQSVGALLAGLANAGSAATDAARKARHAEVEAKIRPLLTEAKSLEARLGILKSKHLSRISEVANQDWAAIRAVTPENMTMIEGRLRSLPHEALWRLRTAAQAAFDALRSTLGDLTPGHRDLDPVSLAGVVADVETSLASGNVFDGEALAQSFQRSMSHLNWWLAKARGIVTAAAEGVTRFDATEAHAKKILTNVAPLADIPVAPEKISLPPVPETPLPHGTSSYVDFDPRSSMADPKPPRDNVEVTPLGDHAGFRVKGGRS